MDIDVYHFSLVLFSSVEVTLTSFAIALYKQEGQKGVSAITTSQNSRFQEYFPKFVMLYIIWTENSLFFLRTNSIGKSYSILLERQNAL